MRFFKLVLVAVSFTLMPFENIIGQGKVQPRVINSIELTDRDFENICTLQASDINADFRIKAAEMRRKSVNAEKTAEFQITYFQESGTNPWPAQAKAAFEYAMDIWATHIKSDISIRISANWRGLGERTLGSAGPTQVVQVTDGGGVPLTWYSIAQGSAIAGVDFLSQLQEDGSTEQFDIAVNMNSEFPGWYFGTDAQTPEGFHDFVTVVLHEIGHGLGFLGSVGVAEGSGLASWGLGNPAFPIIYDRFVIDGDGKEIIDRTNYPNSSSNLYNAVTGKNGGLYFAGLQSIGSNRGLAVPLYAPSEWNAGSSYSHVDYTTYTNTENALMRPQIETAFAVHSPGPVTCSIMSDKGWPMGPDCAGLLGTNSEIVLQAESIDFGVTNAGKVLSQTFTIANDMNATDPLVGRFSISGNSSFSLAGSDQFITLEPGEQTEITISFSPNAIGVLSGTIQLEHTSENFDSPQIIAVKGEALSQNKTFKLEQNYPNPFNASTVIPYALAENARVYLEVFDVMGKRVQTLVNEDQSTGRYTIPFYANDLSSGVYIYRLIVDGESKTGKLLLVK